MNQYHVLHLTEVSSRAEDWVSKEAFTFGALGVSEVLPFDQPEGEEDVFVRVPDQRALDVYFEQPPSREFLKALRTRFPDVRWKLLTEENRDWLAEWKKSFQPFALVGEHWVVPSWCEAPPTATHNIWIDPGMAFGTGTHETTQLVARFLVEQKFSSGSLLDVGTGTGILAILARQLGFATVHATEIESDARRVAQENFAKNACADIRLDERQVEELSDTYDVVVANIIDGVLVRIQDALKARVKPGGWLVLSGIIAEREPDFLRGFVLPAGAKWITQSQGDWRLYSVKL